MTAPIRSLTALPLDDHACRDCDGRGYNVDPSAHDYAPGARRRVPCNTCRPHVADTAPRVSKDDLMDAAIADMGLTPSEYWAGVAFVAVGTLIVTVAAQWVLDAAVVVM